MRIPQIQASSCKYADLKNNSKLKFRAKKTATRLSHTSMIIMITHYNYYAIQETHAGGGK